MYNEEDENNVVSGYLLSDGEIVDSDYFEKRASVTSSSKDKSNVLDLDIDDFGESYSSGRVYRPSLLFRNLKSFSLENPFHEMCIKQIAQDCCGDWSIEQLDKNGDSIPSYERKKQKKDGILNDFFENCNSNPLETFTDLSRNLMIDYLTFGWCTTELTRTKNKLPSKLYHTPCETLRISRDLSDYINTDEKFMVQIVNRHERIFKIFNRDPFTVVTEPHTGNWMTEILYMRNYHVDGGKYGIPDWFPALKALLGYDKVAEYNITFFDNEAVPRFAVVVTGGKLDNDTKKTIQNYFKKDLKGVKNSNKTLVLTGPKGIDIKLQPLGTDNKDGSFRFYKKDNRDEIITSHRLPHHRLQVLDAGNSGTISPGTVFNLDKIYKYSVVIPLQIKLSNMLNNIIKYGFGIDDRKLVYKDLDIGEDSDQATIKKTIAAAHEKYYAIGAMTPNQIMQDLKLTPYTKETCEQDILEWATTPRPVYLIRQAQLQAQMQTPTNGLNTNTPSDNLNQSPNEFDDKSKQQTQGNTQFTDEQLQQLTMKRAVAKVLEQMNEELRLSISKGDDTSNETSN